MVDNLPLIPGKHAACTDVRGVLRTVFRELDYLPPLAVQTVPTRPPEDAGCAGEDGDHSLPGVGRWVDKYKSDCKKVSDHEEEIKTKHAKRVAQEPLPNLFKLHEKKADKQEPQWTLDRGLLSRKDLTPAVEQNAGRDGSLWVKNILNVSSCNISTTKVGPLHPVAPVVLNTANEPSVQTFSVGGVVACRESPAASLASSPERVDYILCVPPQLNFINCFVGQTYMKCIRLINVTKFECRLSITPPRRRELDVEINSPRGLTITSGATVELRIRFKPANVRVLTDRLVVRVSRGQVFAVPIECYMEPPLLGIAVPAPAPASSQASVSSLSLEAECGNVLELGARLLGDVHCARVLLQCDAAHAAFFVLTEDAWLDWDLDCVTWRGAVVAESFAWWPAAWRGGGAVRACAWLAARAAGAHEAALRVLSATATQRRVNLLGDSLHYSARHLALEAHEKDFDIGGEADAACEYYVHVGTAHPHRALATSVRLVNCSPIAYNYYWGSRRWGVCFCWDEERASGDASHVSDDSGDERRCFGAREAKRQARTEPATFARRLEAEHAVEVSPARGELPPHAARTLEVRVPDVGGALGVQRSVLRLILKDIPRESFVPGHEPVILSTAEVERVPVPGLERSVHEVCEVVCAEMEVWWEVVPLRFVVHPPVVPMCHSRRLDSIELQFTACKLFGGDLTRAWWSAPLGDAPALQLGSGHVASSRLALPLPRLPNHYPETDVLTLVTARDEWRVSCAVQRRCATRHPALRPAARWLGVVLPRTRLRAAFALRNDTFQHICFWCTAYRWLGENPPRPACEGRIPCRACRELACTCALLAPARGALAHGEAQDICYDVNAPERDGCVATLLQARRCSPDLSVVHGAPATEARASLVAYRVLAPRVTLRVHACPQAPAQCGAACALDAGARGAATLRPGAALVAGRRSCYRLRVANLTPLATSVHFDEPLDGTDTLAVKFLPNDFRVAGHGEVDVRVVLSARRVSRRRVFVYRARVALASRPLYLVVDTAISGLELSLQVPMGGGVVTDEFVIMRRTQTEISGDDESRPATPEEMFVEEDRKRAIVRENICRCHFDLQYIPPVVRPAPPLPYGVYKPPEIITKPPSLTRVCRCFPFTKPSMPDAPESISLQFINIPLRKVCSRRLVLRNESVATAHWRGAVRRWPRRHARALGTDQWAGDVCWPGVALACSPARGVLASATHAEISVQVYADCWGLYHDQILIKIRNVEPIVLDVWIQVVGAPLQFTIQPHYAPEELPTMWFSSSDLTRSLIVKNVSRSELVVHAYVTHENERAQDALPFRLYMRLFDVLPVTCPCVTAFDSDEGEISTARLSASSHSDVDMDTGVELFLAPDHGIQEDAYYDVQPEECTIKAGDSMEWAVRLRPPPAPATAPHALVMLRLQPQNRAGAGWYRGSPRPQLARLRHAPREARVRLSCEELVVSLCALDLPHQGHIRARKHFRVVNTGNDCIGVSLHTSLPWCIVQRLESGCRKVEAPAVRSDALPGDAARSELVRMELVPRSSTEVCVEVCISTIEAWPCDPPPYAPQRRETTPLHLYDDYQVLTTLPLSVVVEFPVIKIQPALVNFGLVTDGDSRKTYISISHTSTTKTLSLAASVVGCKEFSLTPAALHVAPGECERVYVQYTSVWQHGPAEATITVHECGRAAGAAGAAGPAGAAGAAGAAGPADAARWCRASVAARAQPTLDHKWRRDVHDHTDDERLLPPGVRHFLP